MLILTRRISESIYIGDNILVKILDISKDGFKIKIGIEAPEGIDIWRNEIYEKIKKDKINED